MACSPAPLLYFYLYKKAPAESVAPADRVRPGVGFRKGRSTPGAWS